MAGGKGGKELAHLIPVRRDPVQMNGALLPTDDGREWPIIFVGINAIDPLPMQTADAGTKPFAKHREGGKIQFDVPMRIGVVFLGVEVGFVIEQAVKDVGGIALSTLNRYGIKWRIVVGNEGIEL